MGIVKITEEIHEELRTAAKAFDRSLNGQAEHWIKIGMLAELHPSINYQEILKLLLRNEDLSIAKMVKQAKQ